MNSKDPSIHNNLAWLYAKAKDEKFQDKAKALEHAAKAAELSNERNSEILDTLARAQVIAAYPITPQTSIAEALSEMVSRMKLNAGAKGISQVP